MADNFIASPGAGGDTFAADEITGVKYPRSKIGFGSDGAYVDVDNANPLPVDVGTVPVTGTFWQATQPVSGPLTDAQLRASAVPVSAAALPLPTGAATEATLAVIAETVGNSNSPYIAGSAGQLMLARRRDIDTSPAADGDMTILNLDEEGRLKVASKPASYPDITGDITAIQATIGTPVVGGTVAGDVSRASNVMAFCTGTFSTVNCTFEGSLEASGETNWFTVQAVRTNANTIETTTGNLSAQPTYSWEMSVNGLRRVRVRATARTSGTQSWRFVLGTYATEPIPAAQISGTQPVSGTVTSNLATPTARIDNSAASTNAIVVKASAGTIYGGRLTNNGAAVAYFKLHNSTTITVGTTAVATWVKIPAGDSVDFSYGTLGLRHGTGICYSITGAVADNDTTAVAAGQVKVNLSYV